MTPSPEGDLRASVRYGFIFGLAGLCLSGVPAFLRATGGCVVGCGVFLCVLGLCFETGRWTTEHTGTTRSGGRDRGRALRLRVDRLARATNAAQPGRRPAPDTRWHSRVFDYTARRARQHCCRGRRRGSGVVRRAAGREARPRTCAGGVMRRLARRYGDDHVRLTVWFDS